jgi:signal transduction histidine kinase
MATMVPPSATDDQWARLLSLAVHELRTPISVVSGYLRMVLKDRAGPVPEAQRRLLEEAEKSCGRITALLSEMSDFAHLQLGDAPFRQEPVDLAALVRQAVEAAAAGPDLAPVTLVDDESPARIHGDGSRLQVALSALIRCLQREVPSASSIVVHRTTRASAAFIAIGESDTVSTLSKHVDGQVSNVRATFDELRGGMGMSLPLAARVVERHGGQLIVLADKPKAGVVVKVPLG